MRIGLFTDTYPPFINGVSTSVLMLKQGLEKLGHEVYVVTVNDESFSYKEEDGVLKIPSFPIGLMNFRQSGIYPLKALKIIKKWKLDIIHSHTEFSIGTFARLISKQLNIPLVHTYHTMYEEYIYYITKGYFDSASKKLVEYLTLFLYLLKQTSANLSKKSTSFLFLKPPYSLAKCNGNSKWDKVITGSIPYFNNSSNTSS